MKTTSWTQVLAAQSGNKQAIKQLCEDYWPAVYSFLRCSNFSVEDAEDYAQSFFFVFLEKDWVQRVDQQKGRFRTFLLTLLKRFVQDRKFSKQNQFEKNFIVPKESASYIIEPVNGESAEDYFHKIWAESLLEMVLHEFRIEVQREKQMVEYEILWLMFFSGSPLLLFGDIKNPSLFFEQLQSSSLPIFTRKFSSRALEIIRSYKKNTMPAIDQQKMIIGEINQIFSLAAVYDQTFSFQHAKEYFLYPVDINNVSTFLEILTNNSIASFFSREVIQKFKKYSKSSSLTPTIQENLLNECNQILGRTSFYEFLYQQLKTITKYPHLAETQTKQEQLIVNRILLESLYPSLIQPCFVRINKVFLQQHYCETIVKNIYCCASPSYSQLANALDLYKSRVEFIKGKAIRRYRRLLLVEVERYCDESMVEEEIQELLQIFTAK
ncbi:RNA polymerase sigma factor [Candidatus Uabimicrobium sp. HlEnr_7]|uniref:RNA polymerase sigma factor n=1 Tax=Candidatus Uabimicrobium helgolandensis TaxID=3095367 RepID=UPI003557239E